MSLGADVEGSDRELTPGRPQLRVYASSKQSTTVFLIHGAGGRAEQFEAQSKLCRELGFGVVALDLLGHGASPKPAEESLYLTAELLKDVEALFEAHKTERNFIVAHSYGTVLALQLAQKLTERGESSAISKMVLIGSSATSPSTGGVALYLPATVLEWLRPLARNEFNRKAFHPDTSPEFVAKENEITAQNPMYVMKAVGKGIRWDIPPCTKDFTFPSLLLTGETDGITPVAGATALQEQVARSSFHVVEKGGHNCFQERPAEVNEHLKTFFLEE
eukprot:CAMPEP_0117002716 /NCGR_PEP_ID=MMETSP0472-20121206/4284_1 /TAXON_ID=693140 ORGANISM="Tiarina fusus, Strain LIS" /NCGR_SAMPLE_ID=MMETSP0472 /ASSEMBLY_ACC=CAM_ASM_000603 /LENGTH=275 /DNA_ID=CAMNT_0004703139 /DNA_START=6 /DNA_END=833 /DNA_ORIENTATION=+